jgi:hypothetical protein
MSMQLRRLPSCLFCDVPGSSVQVDAVLAFLSRGPIRLRETESTTAFLDFFLSFFSFGVQRHFSLLCRSLGAHFFLVPRFPSKSGLMNKHIVKTYLVPRFPSKSGLMNKHIVKHILKHIVKHILLSSLPVWFGLVFLKQS